MHNFICILTRFDNFACACKLARTRLVSHGQQQRFHTFLVPRILLRSMYEVSESHWPQAEEHMQSRFQHQTQSESDIVTWPGVAIRGSVVGPVACALRCNKTLPLNVHVFTLWAVLTNMCDHMIASHQMVHQAVLSNVMCSYCRVSAAATSRAGIGANTTGITPRIGSGSRWSCVTRFCVHLLRSATRPVHAGGIAFSTSPGA